jgi:hypothetical protein
MVNPGTRFHAGSEERFRLLLYVLLWVVLWVAVATQVLAPLERGEGAAGQTLAPIEQALLQAG